MLLSATYTGHVLKYLILLVLGKVWPSNNELFYLMISSYLSLESDQDNGFVKFVMKYVFFVHE